MALCLVGDVRAYFSPESLEDTAISDIIDQVSEEIALDYGVGENSTDPNLKRACVHLSTALTMKKAKTTGELAQSIKSGSNYSINMNIEQDIRDHENQAQGYFLKYSLSNLGIISGRTGARGVNYEP